MSRWEPDARGRLAKAALELYSERGFEETTVSEIAKRAGLTERTFFRHFSDKREVLFAGGSALEEHLVRAVADVPDTASAMDVVRSAVASIGDALEPRGRFARQRQRVIDANPELQERERIKLASLASALITALRRRGIQDSAATVAGEMGIAVFRIAFARWIAASNRRKLSEIIGESFDELNVLIRSG
jgi:AcrR family transcriptional regulator